jgi:methyl-accepting chemotaxis protein
MGAVKAIAAVLKASATEDSHSRPSGSMKPQSKYSLQRTMIVYFLLIGFAALLVGVEFIAETHGEDMRQAFLAGLTDNATNPTDEAVLPQPLAHLRNKAILVIAIIMVVILIVMTMFMKHITEPLQHMIAASRKISGGDLSQTIRIEGNNELAELGGVINEMSSNLQEIIHMSRHVCEAGETLLATVDEAPSQKEPGAKNKARRQADMDRFRSELGMLQTALNCFRFYVIPESKV